MNLAIKDIFMTISYGDSYRLPLNYIATNTDKPSIKILLPTHPSMQSKQTYQQFPELSQELIITLFSEIGVKYVPEVTLYQLNEKRPIEIFQEFISSFGVSIKDRRNTREVIDTDILNLVISSLKKMDSHRENYSFDSRPIYKLLSQQEFTKAEILISKLKESELLLSQLLKEHKNISIQEEIKTIFIESWDRPKVVSNLIKRIKND